MDALLHPQQIWGVITFTCPNIIVCGGAWEPVSVHWQQGNCQIWGNKQRVLMHGHQGWNVRHGLCHIYMRYVYTWVVYSFCLFCCLFIVGTWWYVCCIEWASGNQEEVQACLVTLCLFIISCYSLYKTTLGLLCSWFEINPYFHKYIFRVTGHLCGEFTGHRWIPRTKASDAELWCFLWCTPE